MNDTQRAGRVAPLDSLRGYAALSVFLYHVLDAFYPSVVSNDISNVQTTAGEALSAVFGGPFAFVVNGRFAVVIFFVLSGVVISVRTLGKTQQENRVAIAHRLFRLFPVACLASITGAILVCVSTSGLRALYLLNGATRLEVYPRWEEMTWASIIYTTFVEIWADSGGPLFDTVLWTIGIELRHSIFLMLWLSLLGNSPIPVRHLLGAVLGVLLTGRYYWCFAIGIVIGDMLRAGALESIRRSYAVSVCCMAIALQAGNYHVSRWSLFNILDCVMPSGVGMLLVYTGGGAAAVLWAVSYVATSRVFGFRFGYLLGWMSYSFYAFHQPIIHAVGGIIVSGLYPSVGYDVACAATCVILLCGNVALACCVTRVIDDPWTRKSKDIIRLYLYRDGPPDTSDRASPRI